MIPETAKRPDWPRLVKAAFEKLQSLLTTTNSGLATVQAQADATDTALTALDVRVTAVEANKTFASVIFTPGAAPGSPVEGQTYQDGTTHKLRTWDGTAWQDHW